MASEKARVDVLFQCLYLQFGVTKGHPILSFRWPLTPQPEPEVGQVYGGQTFNIGSTNVVLIRDQGVNIIVDPGIMQIGRYGAFPKRLAEYGLKTDDIDIVVNTHCHYDHIEGNYLFRGKNLIVHEKELEYCRKLYWPEFADAFMGIMDVNAINGTKQLTKNVKVIETLGHTPGSITVLAETEEGLVACVGDAVIVKEDLLELKAPQVVTKNTSAEIAIESLKRIAALNPVLVIPGHDAPFKP
ncbi:MBL fold metallo-hydrolase [Candidatus Bathyarchaeota archaeon]|nr:MBL fold metallo-hydrolase [Candidatus Bathyarchaeota archaeon]